MQVSLHFAPRVLYRYWSETRCRLMSTRARFPCSHGKCRYASRQTASGRLLGGGAGSRRVVECAIVTSTFRCRCHGVWVGARQGLRTCTTHVSRHAQAPVRVLGCIGTRRACEYWRQPSHPNPPSTTPPHQPPFAAELASSASCSMACVHARQPPPRRAATRTRASRSAIRFMTPASGGRGVNRAAALVREPRCPREGGRWRGDRLARRRAWRTARHSRALFSQWLAALWCGAVDIITETRWTKGRFGSRIT